MTVSPTATVGGGGLRVLGLLGEEEENTRYSLTAAVGILHRDCSCEPTDAVGILHGDRSCMPRLTLARRKAASTFRCESSTVSPGGTRQNNVRSKEHRPWEMTGETGRGRKAGGEGGGRKNREGRKRGRVRRRGEGGRVKLTQPLQSACRHV